MKTGYELYEQTVREMIKDKESPLYIRIYINDLRRGRDITKEECSRLHDIVIKEMDDPSFTL